jgi:hypothetical protein
MVDQNSFWLVASIAVLAALAAYWVYSRLKLRRARTWPAGEGRVNSTQLRLQGTGSQQSRWIGEVTYSYDVAGVAYSGRLRRSFLLHGSATKWAEAYSNGRLLAVRYNPKNSRDSVLLEGEQGEPAVDGAYGTQ